MYQYMQNNWIDFVNGAHFALLSDIVSMSRYQMIRPKDIRAMQSCFHFSLVKKTNNSLL